MCRKATLLQDCLVCRALARPACGHLTEVCRNYVNHPFDVTFYKNAEIAWFNKCGYCKWARANPTADPNDNVGWPGCCRPPMPPEYAMIKEPTEWDFIARMHIIAIPPEVRRTWKDVGLTTPRAAHATIPAASSQGAVVPTPSAALSRASDTKVLPVASPPLGVSPPMPSAPKRVPVPAFVPAMQRNKSAALDQVMASLSLSSTLSSSDDDRLETCTVTSEGFTDYLSDSSEEELNRQALERVQRQREEEEFRAARAILATVDVTPPAEWNVGGQRARLPQPTMQQSRPTGSGHSPSASLSSISRSVGAVPTAAPQTTTTSAAQIARAMAAQPRAAPTQAPLRNPQMIRAAVPAVKPLAAVAPVQIRR